MSESSSPGETRYAADLSQLYKALKQNVFSLLVSSCDFSQTIADHVLARRPQTTIVARFVGKGSISREPIYHWKPAN